MPLLSLGVGLRAEEGEWFACSSLTFEFMNANPELLKRITVDDRICNGKPVIRGMRITAQTVLEFLMAGTPEDEVLKQYPMLEREDLDACRQFALSLMGNSFSVKDIAA